MRAILLTLIAILGFSPVLTAKEPAVRIDRDVPYLTTNSQILLMDIARPLTPGPHPLVVCLHGGAWKYGTKRDFSGGHPMWGQDFGTGSQCLIAYLAERGYTAAAISYRFAPRYKFPTQLEDAKSAIRFLKQNAKRYGVDPDHVAAWGFSAGAHIAALVGTVDSSAGLEGSTYKDVSSRVNCVVDFFGPSDLSLYTESEGIEKAFMVPLLGTRYQQKPEAYKLASPIDHVSKDDPPFLIIHGTADLIVPIIHSERLHAKFQEVGVKSQLLPVTGKGHGWHDEAAVETTQAAIQFLDQQLKAKK